MNPNLSIRLQDSFSKIASRYPDHIAVEDCTSPTPRLHTFKMLENTAKAFSHFIAHKVGSSPFVVCFLPSGYEFLVSILGSLYAGRIIVLMHASYTPRQVQKCLSALQDPLVITTESRWEKLAPHVNHTKIHFLTDEWPTFESKSEETRLPNSLDGVAYCLFTSGSTGEPKAVLITHDALMNGTLAVIGTDPSIFAPSMRGLMGVSNTFVLSFADIWPMLLTGGTLVIPAPQIKLDMDSLLPWLTQMRITSAVFATPVMELLCAKDLEKLTTLKWVGFAGTPLNPHRILLSDAGFDAFNFYGSTEMFLATVAKIPKGTLKASPSVGKAMRNNRIYIVDEDGAAVVSLGERGEIYYTGPGVMRGYHGNEALTEQVLEKVPFDPDWKYLMYRSGDIGYWTENGDLMVVGRKDDQVKIHGIRLELGEIEVALEGFPGIGQAAAILIEINGNPQIHAFCTLEPGVEAPEVKAVQEFLIPRLEKHAIPTGIQFMTDLPRTATGKINKSELRGCHDRTPQKNVNAVPTCRLTGVVLAVWEDVLCRAPNQLQPTDNFFYLGGNSMLAFQVARNLRDGMPELGEVNPLLLFQYPVLRDFVASLGPSPVITRDVIDFEKETQLPEDFPKVSTVSSNPRTGILITGATGFLGRFLLMHAQERFRYEEFFCLIRAHSDEEAEGRLDSVFAESSLHPHLVRPERIKCIAADLAQPKFGLKGNVYEELLGKVGMIFHSAAEVHMLKTYEQLKPTTVAMTLNIIRFALEGNITLSYMSTVGVFDGIEDLSGGFSAREERLPPNIDPRRMANGYCQSKWVSEQLVWKAIDRGLRASIFRIGQVGAHMGTGGKFNPNDAMTGFISICKKLGYFPAFDLHLPFIDADVTKEIVYLGTLPWTDEDKEGRAYHIVGKAVAFKEFFHGGEMEECELDRWHQEFGELTVDGMNSQDEINAWVFLHIMEGAPGQVASNYRRLLKDIPFSTEKTVSATGILLSEEVHPNYYANLLRKAIGKVKLLNKVKSIWKGA